MPTIDFKSFFKTTEKEIIFTGDKLVCHIPERYENYDVLSFHEDTVKSLGIFDLIINDTHHHGLLLAAIISLNPRMISKHTHDNDKVYYHLTFNKNDVFITDTTFVKNENLVYIVFSEFIQLGNIPKFLTYDTLAFLMVKISKTSGLNFKVNHAIVEIMLAHLTRNPNKLTEPYRRTDQSNPLKFIPLSHVSYGADNTTSKLLGSYFTDGLRSALVNQADTAYEFESIIRA
jgi:hypothetical protein